MKKSNKINVAVIGTGNMGKNHARIFSELKDCNLVAICDINPKTMEQISKEFSCHGYLDYKKMLAEEKIDAVSIAVPTKQHKKISIDCLNKKINTLVEKPIACNLKDAEIIINTAKANKTLLTVGHIERFNPAIVALKKKIDKGVLGEIVSIDAKRVGPFVPKNRDTGVILDLAVHDVDIFNYLLNDYPSHIYANGGRSKQNNFEDYADIFLIFKKVSGHIQVNWVNPIKIRELSITGTKGYARLNYITQELFLYNDLEINNNLLKKTSSQEKVEIKYGEPLKLELQSFLNSVAKKTTPLVNPEDAKNTLKITKIALKRIHG